MLGDATHPAYVWARGKATGPNNLWAKVTALGGFVSAYSGNLILGGDQTGIGDEIAVNAGSLQLGSSANSCQLAKDLPIRIYANAALKLPNASSATGNILKFDGAAGWFGKVEVPSGVAAKCRKAYWAYTLATSRPRFRLERSTTPIILPALVRSMSSKTIAHSRFLYG